MISEGLDAEAFGRIVASGDEMGAGLPCYVHHPLGGLTGDVGIEPGGDGLVKRALCRPTDNADSKNGSWPRRKTKGLLLEYRSASIEQLGKSDPFAELSLESQAEPRRVAEGLELRQSQPSSRNGVVADLGMAIERQMIRNQVQVSLNQLRYTAELVARKGSGRSFPEDAVMDENSVGLSLTGAFKELPTG